jgi:hypothetical protein
MTVAEAPASLGVRHFLSEGAGAALNQGNVAGMNPAKSAAWQPLAALGVAVAGTTMPPAGCSFAVVAPATGPANPTTYWSGVYRCGDRLQT